MVHRWRLEDPSDPDPATKTWQFPINPNAMTPLFAARNITNTATTALDGQALFFEGNPRPQEWTFSGDILDKNHYEQLRSWVYDRKRRVYLYDHFGRRLTLQLTSFEPTPKRSVGKYWRHTYDIKAFVVAISAPTADNGGYINGSLDNSGDAAGVLTPVLTSDPNRLTVAFSGAGSTSSKSSITTFSWIFGDGHTGDGMTTTHTYDAPGTYAVTLIIADAAGGVGTVTRTVSVDAPVVPPIIPPPIVPPVVIAAPTVDFTFTVDGTTVTTSGGLA